MDIDEITEIYQLISKGSQHLVSRKQEQEIRKEGLDSFEGFKKVSFDTRRIDQENEINPRRGLQNYTRSEPFISKGMHDKLVLFDKLKKILLDLKEDYSMFIEWQDSYARTLLSAINRSLRTDQKDGDFTDAQPGVGNLDYLTQILFTRYRLSLDDLARKMDEEIKKILLSRDEELMYKEVSEKSHKNAIKNYPDDTIITKREIVTQPYDSLVDKLFGGVKASAENQSVERTVSITIKDNIVK